MFATLALGVFHSQCMFATLTLGVFHSQCMFATLALGVFHSQCMFATLALGVFHSQCMFATLACFGNVSLTVHVCYLFIPDAHAQKKHVITRSKRKNGDFVLC